MIKYGIKLWSTNKDWFDEAASYYYEKKIDFVEISIIPDGFLLENLSAFKNIVNTIHSPHYEHNFNILQLSEKNRIMFKDKAIGAADYLNSKYIIMHAGVGNGKEAFKKNIEKIYDKRIIVENKPKIVLNGIECFGHSFEQLEYINKECGFNLCLDFNHAIVSAFSQKINYKLFLDKIIKAFKPSYFHICDGFSAEETEEHLNLGEGDFDLKFIKNKLEALSDEKEIFLVFETPKINGNLQNDLKNIEYFKRL